MSAEHFKTNVELEIFKFFNSEGGFVIEELVAFVAKTNKRISEITDENEKRRVKHFLDCNITPLL